MIVIPMSLVACCEAKRQTQTNTKPSVRAELNYVRALMAEFLQEMDTKGHAAVLGTGSLTDWKFETFLQWWQKKENANG